MKLDVLAIAAHPDDVELTCGGTLIKMAARGYKTGILDLTRGEMGTRGTVETRHKEAQAAAKILGVLLRDNVGLPDAGLSITQEQKLAVARHVRRLRPHTVILPYWEGRHPDHYTASILGYEACFLAGLTKLALNKQGLSDDPLPPHRPFKIIYATLYYDIRPTFVVDISGQFETRFQSLMAYKTQFSDQEAGKDLFPAQAEIRSRIEAMARYYGMLGGVTYAEPFLQKEVGLMEDLTLIPVKSI